jgi:hypothetical protein
VGYFFVPFEGEREREQRRLYDLRGSFPDLAAAGTGAEAGTGADDSTSDTGDEEEVVHPSFYTIN